MDLLTREARLGHARGDILSSIENLEGSDHRDELGGDDAPNRLVGRAGPDVLTGRGGSDVLVGGYDGPRPAGAPVDAADWLAGGPGADRFVYAAVEDSPPQAADTLADFDGDEGDRIDLRSIDWNPKVAGVQPLAFIGYGFTGVPGQVRFVFARSEFAPWQLLADRDGDGKADLLIRSKTPIDGRSVLGLDPATLP